MPKKWIIVNAGGRHRIIVTKQLIGDRWLKILSEADCRIEYCTSAKVLTKAEIKKAIGKTCAGAIGQLTESWDKEVLASLRSAGGKVYSNVAVGFNNVDIAAATSLGIPVGNTPGVLTETTAELAVALTFAVARRITESDAYVRAGKFTGWQLGLFLGDLLHRKTLGVVGAGRLGSAYARMMVEGYRMNLIYFDRSRSKVLENTAGNFNRYLRDVGEEPVACRRASSTEELLRESDIVSLHPTLNDSTRHLIDARRLGCMKPNAILINASRGPVIDEKALVAHCRRNPAFRAGLDVYEREPLLQQGLTRLPNVVLLPHIGSATYWTREAMSTIAALNVAGVLGGYTLWKGGDVPPFLGQNPPRAIPSIINPEVLLHT